MNVNVLPLRDCSCRMANGYTVLDYGVAWRDRTQRDLVTEWNAVCNRHSSSQPTEARARVQYRADVISHIENNVHALVFAHSSSPRRCRLSGPEALAPPLPTVVASTSR